jgi:hypothetical protein
MLHAGVDLHPFAKILSAHIGCLTTVKIIVFIALSVVLGTKPRQK